MDVPVAVCRPNFYATIFYKFLHLCTSVDLIARPFSTSQPKGCRDLIRYAQRGYSEIGTIDIM